MYFIKFLTFWFEYTVFGHDTTIEVDWALKISKNSCKKYRMAELTLIIISAFFPWCVETDDATGLFVCFPLSFGSFYGRHASIVLLLLVSLVLLLGPTDDANRLFVLRFLFVFYNVLCRFALYGRHVILFIISFSVISSSLFFSLSLFFLLFFFLFSFLTFRINRFAQVIVFSNWC